MSNKQIICAVLGAENDLDGNLCSDAIQRCDLALEILTNNNLAKIILCGGFGKHFNTTKTEHHQYLKAYMHSYINNLDTQLLGCVDSYNTKADIEGIYKLLEPLENNIELIIITNDYHVLRASILAKKIIGSKLKDIKFLSVSSIKDMSLLKSRLTHEFNRIQEYITDK